jgi:Deoxynucleoside kinase
VTTIQDKTKGLKAVTSDKYRTMDASASEDTGEKAMKKARTDDSSDDVGTSATVSPTSPLEPVSDSILLFERSVMSDRHVFVANCHATGLFQDCEAKVFTDWHSWLLKSFKVMPYFICFSTRLVRFRLHVGLCTA